MMQYIWLVLFVVWGMPLTLYRSRFRKMVYRTDSWLINIKPVFGKELKALFGNIYPNDKAYLRLRNFYRVYLLVYVILFAAYMYFKPVRQETGLAIGSHVPSFTLPTQDDVMYPIDSVLGKKNLVIYFYPKDDSPGCTKQACTFRDQFEVFAEADALIIGISSQSVQSHKEFAEKHNLNFTLLADEHETVHKLFGVPSDLMGLLSGRVTYIVDKQGKIVYIFNSQMNAEQHVAEALRILKEMK